MQTSHFKKTAGTASTQTPMADFANDLGLRELDHMSINVANFERAVAWYSEVLGLDVDVSWRVGALAGKQLAYLSLNGRRVVEIVAADESGIRIKPDQSFGAHFGRTGFGHLCFATDSVDTTMAMLEQRGVEAFVNAETYPLDGTEFIRRVAFVQDPEGNVVEFGEPLRVKP